MQVKNVYRLTNPTFEVSCQIADYLERPGHHNNRDPSHKDDGGEPAAQEFKIGNRPSVDDLDDPLATITIPDVESKKDDARDEYPK